MRRRIAIAIVMGLGLSAFGPTAYAHDDGKGDSHPPGQAAQAHEFANVKAANANPDSNAPKSFAPASAAWPPRPSPATAST